jgi:hypothetical protein
MLTVPCPPSATYIGQGVDAHLRSTSAWIVNDPVISLGKLGVDSSSDEVRGSRKLVADKHTRAWDIHVVDLVGDFSWRGLW